MALITCPECGNPISDKSTVCIYCGFPISESSIYGGQSQDAEMPKTYVEASVTRRGTHSRTKNRAAIQKARRRKRRRRAFAIIGVVLIGLLFFGVCLFAIGRSKNRSDERIEIVSSDETEIIVEEALEQLNEDDSAASVTVIDNSITPIVDDTLYMWEGNDVFSRFYSEYHANTGAEKWEHLGISGHAYQKPGNTSTDWFDIYAVIYNNGAKDYYAIEYGQIQLTDVYEIQSDNSLLCVWSIALEEYYPWMKEGSGDPIGDATNVEDANTEAVTRSYVDVTVEAYNQPLSDLLQHYKYSGYTVLACDTVPIPDAHPYKSVAASSNNKTLIDGNPLGMRYVYSQDEDITMMYQNCIISSGYISVYQLVSSVDIINFTNILDVEPEITQGDSIKFLAWQLNDVIFVVETLGSSDWKANRVLGYSFVVNNT